MRNDAVNAIRDLEPYLGGKGEDLWTLHQLNNIDKHRLVITVFSSLRRPLNAGDELLTMPADTEPNQNQDFGFEVALHEPGIIDDKALVPTLVEFSDLVSSIVQSFRTCLK